MIVTCTHCQKVFTEDSIRDSVEEHFNKLSGRMAKHIKLKHPEELTGMVESQANYVTLLVLMQFDCEDAWFTKQLEAVREAVSQDVQADFDPFYAGAVAACWYFVSLLDKNSECNEIFKTDVDSEIRALKEKYEVTQEDIAEYGKALAENEEPEKEEEEEEVKEDESKLDS